MNGVLNAVGDALFWILSPFSAVIVILALAGLTAAGSLVVFKHTSNQEKIRAAKGPLKAHLLGILLFRHDLRQVFRALGLALLTSLANLRFLVVPMLVMIVPLVLLFIQFDARLSSRGFRPGETAVLRVLVKPGRSLDDVSLQPGEGIAVETPGVRVSSVRTGLHEVDFRLRAVKEGVHALTVRAGGLSVEKRITVGGRRPLLSPVRTGGGFLDAVLNPGEPPLPPAASLSSVEISYPPVTYAFLGIDWAWWTLFLVFLVVALYVLKAPLGVDF